MSSSITDQIKIELREPTFPYAVVATTFAYLKTNGNASCSFNGIYGPFYITITHRSGLQTWSANPIVFTPPSVSYDFSNAANKAYGNNMIQIEPGVWCIYSGDLNVDENIDLLDDGILNNDISNFLIGYQTSDINGDGNVDLLDKPDVENNILSFIFSNHP
jgi:hypothetical protein